MKRTGLGILAGALAMLAVAAPVQAAPTWADGPIERSYITNCPSIIFGSPYTEEGAWTWTGQYIDIANPPDTNEVFYIHVVAGAVGNSCAGQYVHFELMGPPGHNLLVNATAAHPIICYAINWNTNPASAQQEPPYGSGGNCPVLPQNGAFHPGQALSFDAQTSATSADPWPLPQGKGWEIQIPVQSPDALSGGFGACNDCNTFDNFIIDGNSGPHLFPRQGLFVSDTTPGGGSSNPSTGGGAAGAGAGFAPNAQKAPPAPAPAAPAKKKCKKGKKLKKGKCVKKKKKKK
jgi:hypothetical protein